MNIKSRSRHIEQGNAGNLILGFIMMCSGIYLLLHSIVVTHHYFMGMGMYRYGNTSISSGMVMILLMIGIGMVFYKPSNIFGWIVVIGSIIALIVGVIMNTHFALRSMSLFELLGIIILAVGGMGLFLRGCIQRGKHS